MDEDAKGNERNHERISAMNNERRKKIDEAMGLLEKLKSDLESAMEIIQQVGEEEQECFDALTEGLQSSERGQRMAEVANELSEIADELQIDIDYFITRLYDTKN